MPLSFSPIRFGIIGTGAITTFMRPAFLSPDGPRAVAVSDLNEAAAQAEAKELGAPKVFTDYRKLLKDPDVDAVYIATPPFLHREMILAGLDAGKHVLCEKPFLMNGQEANEIATRARETKLKVGSCSCRFQAAPPIRRAKELLAENRIGRLLRIRAQFVLPPPAQLEALNQWKQSRRTAGGGLVMSWGVYDLDWLQYLLGEAFDPVSVFATTDNWRQESGDFESSFSAKILLASGSTLLWERQSEHGPTSQRVEIRGTEGALDLPAIPADAPTSLRFHQYDDAKQLRSQTESEPITAQYWGSTLHYPVYQFAEAVAQNQEPASPPSTQVKIHALIDALYESAERGTVVEVKR